MKIWTLLSNVDDMLPILDKLAPGLNDGTFELIIADYINIEIGNGIDLRVNYKGQPLELPDAFWPMISNTDSFVLENMLIGAGVKSIINIDEVAVARSKIATYQRLVANGVRVPDSIVFFNRPNKDTILEHFCYPFVIKPDNGFGGEGVKLIHSESELDEYLSGMKTGIAYISQEYIASSRGKDVRVILLYGEFLYSSMRSATKPGEFRSNVHVGGELLEYKIDEPTLKMCQRVAAMFDLPLIGLDLLFGDSEFVIAEVNAFPGLYPNNLIKTREAILKNYTERISANGKT